MTRKTRTDADGFTIKDTFADEFATHHRDVLAYRAGRWWICEEGTWREARGHQDTALIRTKICQFAKDWVPYGGEGNSNWRELGADFAYRVRNDTNGYYQARNAIMLACAEIEEMGGYDWPIARLGS